MKKTKKTVQYLNILFLSVITLIGCVSETKNVMDEKVIAFDTSFMDKSVSPFANFDRFVNGKWQDTAKMPNGYGSWGSFYILNENNEKKIEKIILDVTQKTNPIGTSEQKVADFYLSYIDTQTIEKRGNEPLKKLFGEIDEINNNQAWIKFYALNNKYLSSVYDFGVDADARNSKMNAVYFSQGGLSIGDRDFYVEKSERNATILKEFKNLVKEFLLFAGEKEEQALAYSQQILKLETEIAEVQITKVERRDPVKTYNKMSAKSLIALSPDLYIGEFITNISNLSKADSIIVENLEYFKKVGKIISQTNISVLKAWFKFKLVATFAPYLTTKIVNVNNYFFKEVMNGIKTDMARKIKAIKQSNYLMGELIGKIYVEKYFPESSKNKIAEMIENMRLVFKERIEKNDWMSSDTKKQAIIKLAAFTYKIGYPNKWKDYSTISIDKATLVENVMSVKGWMLNETVNKIGKPVDKTEWGMTPQTVNAYYNPLNNEIVFPAGILQPPFYNPDADDAINYGGILGVIGHEFTHGFDDQGSQFDAEGNLKIWWTKDDRKKFEAKANLVGKVYENYKGLKSKATINGKFTMGENIADVGGITIAYYALLKSLENKPIPADIDGFNYKQRFFLSWGQVWRSICTNEYEQNQTISDPHSPANARINVTTSLTKEFYETWKNYDSKYTLDEKKIVVIW